jgi:hypothetical protein
LQLGTAGLGITIALSACIVIPIVLVLSILRNFAERACMLEDLGVIDAYRRGTSVLMANLGEAIILFLLQIVITIVLGILLFLPGLALVLCCLLWPLLLVVQGWPGALGHRWWRRYRPRSECSRYHRVLLPGKEWKSGCATLFGAMWNRRMRRPSLPPIAKDMRIRRALCFRGLFAFWGSYTLQCRKPK